MGASNCSGLPPKWDVDFWAGDHSIENNDTHNKGGFVRCMTETPDGKSCSSWGYIYSDTPLIDQYIAVHKSAIQKLYDDVLSKCEKWNGSPSLDILNQ